MQEIEKRKSEVSGVVPEGWKWIFLENVAGIDKETLSGSTPKEYEFDYISLSDVDSDTFKIESTKQVFGSAPSRARRIVKMGDILMSTVRPNLQGFSLIKNEVKDLIASTGFAVITVEKCNNEYLFHYLFSNAIQKQFYQLLVGSNYPAINSSDVRKLKFLLPTLPEQQAIADCLSTWDGAIQVSEQLIRQKELQKKWLMQQLLTGKKRLKGFSGEWKNTKMKKIGFIPSKSPLIKIENQRLLTVKLHTKGVEFNNSDRPIISSSGRPYYERFEGEILIGRQNIHNGGIGLVLSEHSGNICSNAISSFKVNPDVSLEFVLHYLVHPDHYKLIEIFMGGTGQKELSEKQFLNLEMKFPSSIKEQQAIAAILSESDRELDLLRERLAKLREQKKGLMQGLLTGKRRLKINF